MERFHIIVLAIATIVLVLILVFIGILLSKGNTNLAYPPNFGVCPDYWVIDASSNKCIIPKFSDDVINVGNMYGSDPSPPDPPLEDFVLQTPGYSYDVSNQIITHYIDFKSDDWSGICSKRKWANENGIVWDGISNYNNC